MDVEIDAKAISPCRMSAEHKKVDKYLDGAPAASMLGDHRLPAAVRPQGCSHFTRGVAGRQPKRQCLGFDSRGYSELTQAAYYRIVITLQFLSVLTCGRVRPGADMVGPFPPPPPRCAAAPRCVAVPHILAPPPAACLCLPARPRPPRGSSALLVDYGSGSARMVAAAAIVAGVASLGIEGDLHRHQLAVVRMGALVWGHLGELVAGMLASAALRFGDASELLVEAAPTHVYAFDSVFSDVGVAAFAQALLAAAPAVFVSFRPPGDLAKLGVCGGGDAPYVCVLKGSAATAGVQKFTYHVYVQRRYYVPRPAAAAVPPPMPPPSPPKPPR